MASWREEYIQALRDRDQRQEASCERIGDDLIEAYANLLDRIALLEAEKAVRASKPDLEVKDRTLPPTVNDGNAQIRTDLAEALRSNGQFQSRIRIAEAELSELRVRTKADAKRIGDLTKERAIFSQKVKDRDDELRGKARFLENAQDEMISLNLQLNISEQNVMKLKAENKDLIDRWMAHKGREADEMNETLG